jgi:hypothetical protein
MREPMLSLMKTGDSQASCGLDGVVEERHLAHPRLAAQHQDTAAAAAHGLEQAIQRRPFLMAIYQHTKVSCLVPRHNFARKSQLHAISSGGSVEPYRPRTEQAQGSRPARGPAAGPLAPPGSGVRAAADV